MGARFTYNYKNIVGLKAIWGTPRFGMDFSDTQVRGVDVSFSLSEMLKWQNTSLSIEGFASPEGPLAFNEQLSKKRAEALKDYLVKNEKVSSKLYKVTFGGENWDGLVKALQSSSMKEIGRASCRERVFRAV